MSLLPRLALALLLGLATRGVAAANAGGMCETGTSSQGVLVVLVPSAQQVAGAAQGLSKTEVLVATRDTVIHADGRVVTSDLDSASRHLNELGWAKRPIEIAGAGSSPAPARRRG